MANGREGDWNCAGCGNRNYAFRSFCNKCKQARLLVDIETPAHSKWLPRIGDWICAGCSNNNYASREKCNKCGEPKEVMALPAAALPRATIAPPLHPLAMAPQPTGSKIDWSFNCAILGGGAVNNDWKWRSGDWLCSCGYHNYSSRVQCNNCQAFARSDLSLDPLQSMVPSGPGNKRVAPHNLDGGMIAKRLNLSTEESAMQNQQASVPPFGRVEQGTHFLSGLGTSVLPEGGGMPLPNSLQSHIGMPNVLQPNPGMMNAFHTRVGITSSLQSNLGMPNSLQANNHGIPNYPQPHSGVFNSLQPMFQPAMRILPSILGKGAKQWREGDWMCESCNNHNYASRQSCNRCGGPKQNGSQVIVSA